MRLLPLSVCSSLALGACSETSVAGLEPSFSFTVTHHADRALALDVLFVFDNSTSMCAEEAALPAAFERFVAAIEDVYTLDARVAVTTADAQCDVDDTTVFASKGRFNTVAAHAYPPGCDLADGAAPDTAGCPAVVPDILAGDDLDLFACSAAVGFNQEKCFTLEQPLRAARLALDARGRDPVVADQARRFLRDDATLVVVIVSDADDCSLGDNATVREDDIERCAFLDTSDTGGPLVPVAHVVERLKGLKADPGKVIVAAVAGDSLAPTEAERAAERAAWVAAGGAAPICRSAHGEAAWGRRLRALAEGFGRNGVFANLCDDTSGVPPVWLALDHVARAVVSASNEVCLPRAVLDLGALTVVRTRDGVATALTRGEGPDSYDLVFGAGVCAADGVRWPAIALSDAPVPGETITIEYRGDPGFE